MGLRKTIHSFFFYICGKYRYLWVLYLVRAAVHVFAGIAPSVSFLLFTHFDPNLIRKRIPIILNPRYVHTQGFFNEDFRVNINDHIGWHMYVYGYFDVTVPALGLLMAPLMPGATFLDVEANIGSSSIALAKHGIPVVAIEASAHVASELLANVALNSPMPFTVIPMAVTTPEQATAQSYADIFSPQGNVAASSLLKNWNPSKSAARIEKTQLTTLDRVVHLTQISKISVVKLDIEGYETEALQGMVEIFKNPPMVVFEWRPELMRKSRGVVPDIRSFFPSSYQFFGLIANVNNKNIALHLSSFDISKPCPTVLALPDSYIEQFHEIEQFAKTKNINVAT